ncbi:hypothetical protein F4821DRAFT_225118 [Hypoxylon rubiginosum]|uniref:Uncharacterized protein n=1 Tax=Hypoxylon rubiginosum TaxID=110542 RepID=A0ACC0DHF8_9PEZI|nr:hypothetical protein F4821DRAFT_225118 [Hypoxylon rubiginosum]
MLRGLNAISLQAPFVRAPGDVADFLFLTQAWSAWVLEHHILKETAMIPGFEAALRLEPGSLATTQGWRYAKSDNGEVEDKGKGKEPEDVERLLQDVHSYAASTMSQPESYSAATLQALLLALGSSLVPHLHNQIALLARMQDLCSPSASTPASTSASASTPSTSSSSSSSSSLPLSLSRAAAAAAAEDAARANRLTQTHLSCESALADRMDRFVVPPMVTRLRDATYEGGSGGAWPRLSVPALHAVADRLSPRHAGAWRFLPCDVWGRPRELEFLGERGHEVRQ